MAGALDDMTWWGQTTSINLGITEGGLQMNTNDAVSDVMLVITDGWDGQLNLLQKRVEIYNIFLKLSNIVFTFKSINRILQQLLARLV